ncbi:nicotinamide phosphoribosyltransferase [Chytriomyces sp. MP71]|nr:nicotinamide phosphoribosyltransferase [Chytriomyces sp. MP71]
MRFHHWQLPKHLLTDSYKTTHPFLYPEAQQMVAYSEFRAPFDKDQTDRRIVLYGLRYLVQTYLEQRWTQDELNSATEFFKTHRASLDPSDPSKSEFPFPRDLFQKMIDENDGYFPVTISALPEGSVIYPHTPALQITAKGEYSRLVTYLETILTHLWYPSTVATLSRRCKDIIHDYFMRSVDEDAFFLLNSRLHDFGFRGCTTVEQSVIGGCAHLLNFEGTDTLSAAYFAQFELNDRKPVATSIPATEHSIMTSYATERAAMTKLIETYGEGFCACVMDSYDYVNALENVLPAIKSVKLSKGGFLVLRPDSGDPVDVVVQGLKAAEKVFGFVKNKKGYKVLNNCGIIQGDGISYHTINNILNKITKLGYSAQNVAFGMGGGLLQKVNRDTMSFATKLCHIIYADGTERDVMKMPKTDAGKTSLPGCMGISKDPTNFTPSVFPLTDIRAHKNAMVILYDCGKPVSWKWETFDQVRTRLNREWAGTQFYKSHDCLSQEMKDKMVSTRQAQEECNEEDKVLSNEPVSNSQSDSVVSAEDHPFGVRLQEFFQNLVKPKVVKRRNEKTG